MIATTVLIIRNHKWLYGCVLRSYLRVLLTYLCYYSTITLLQWGSVVAGRQGGLRLPGVYLTCLLLEASIETLQQLYVVCM